MPAHLKKKVSFVTTNTVDKSSIQKLLSRPELARLLANQRLQKEEGALADEDSLAAMILLQAWIDENK